MLAVPALELEPEHESDYRSAGAPLLCATLNGNPRHMFGVEVGRCVVFLEVPERNI